MIIYKTTNLINQKIYIGQDSKNNSNYLGSGKLLKEAIKEFGKENFKKEILEYCNSQVELNNQERFWVKELNSKTPNGYNITSGGQGTLNWMPSKETLEKQNIARKKRFEDPKEREKLSKAQKKRFENLNERNKISKGQKKRFKNKTNHPMYNKHHSEKSNKKNSLSNKNRFEDPKEREKISITTKIGLANMNDEIRKKMKINISVAMKKRFEDPKEREKISSFGPKNGMSKKLYQYNNKLSLIKLWSYVGECFLNNNNNLKYSFIIANARYNTKNLNNLKSYKGYIFSYKEIDL